MARNDYLMRSANVFRERPFGMPELDDTSVNSMFGSAAAYANMMKDEDLRRRRELMEFEHSLRNRKQIPFMPTNAIQKNRVTVYAPPTAMQQQFKQEADEVREQKYRMGQLQAQQSGALNTALATGRQRSEADMARLAAELNARKEEGAAERASAEKLAANKLAAETEATKAQREFTASENQKNRAQKNLQVVNVPDPNDPTKQVAVKMDLNTGKVEPITHDGKPVTDVTKIGAKPTVPPKLADLRSKTQDALNEIDNILDPKTDKLTPMGARATGLSSYFNWMPATKGYAGNASIKRIKAEQVLNLIGEMKAQSRTGATGFGNMSNKDLAVLENAASKLDTGLDEAEFEKEIKRVRNLLRKVMEDQQTEAEPDSPGTTSTGKRPRLDPAEMYQKYSKMGGR